MTAILVGMDKIDSTDFGKGPGTGGFDTSGPKWTASLLNPTPSTIGAIITAATANNVTLLINFAGSRTTWCTQSGTNLIYNQALYDARVNRYLPVAQGGLLSSGDDTILRNAIAAKTVIGFTVDEPQISIFNNSISTGDMNHMGQLHKKNWPGMITVIRTPSAVLKSPIPAGGFSGLDYGWTVYNRDFAQLQSLSAVAYAQAEQTALAALDMGLMLSNNWLNGGSGNNWDYLNNGTSQGAVVGPKGSPFFICSPAEIIARGAAAAQITGLPMYVDWTHEALFTGAFGTTYEKRSDFVAAWDSVITACQAATGGGWRPAKGTAVVSAGGPIAQTYDEVTTRATNLTETYTTVATKAALTAGKTYLVMVTAQMDYGLGFDAYGSVFHGTTQFPDSEMAFAPRGTANNAHYQYTYWDTWTAVAGEALTFQIRNQAGQVLTVGADQISMEAIPISDLPPGSYQIAKSSGTDVLNTDGTEKSGASLAWTPPVAGNNWLFLTHSRYSGVSTSKSIKSRLDLTGLASTDSPIQVQEGKNATNDRPLFGLVYAGTLPATPTTLTEYSSIVNGDGVFAPTRLSSKVFALDLGRFTQSAVAWSPAELDYSATSFATQDQTLGMTLAAGPKNVWILGAHVMAHTSQGNTHMFRLQVDAADQPPTQTSDSYSLHSSFDASDKATVIVQTVESLAAGAHTFTTAGSLANTTAAAGRGAQARLIVAVVLETPATGGSNSPPVYNAVAAQSVIEGNLLSFSATATDANSDTLAYSVRAGTTPVPAGLVYDAVTGAVTWTPTVLTQRGIWNVIFRATESLTSDHLFAEVACTITVDTNGGGDNSGGGAIAVQDVANRAAADLAIAFSLADLLDQTQQINANVINQIRILKADLATTQAYMANVLASLPPTTVTTG